MKSNQLNLFRKPKVLYDCVLAAIRTLNTSIAPLPAHTHTHTLKVEFGVGNMIVLCRNGQTIRSEGGQN